MQQPAEKTSLHQHGLLSSPLSPEMADAAQDSCQKCVEHSRPAVAAARHAAGPTSEAVQSSASNIKSAKLLVCSCNWLMLQEMRRKGRQNVLVKQEHNCVILVPPPPTHVTSLPPTYPKLLFLICVERSL